jgi:hypothetical protein
VISTTRPSFWRSFDKLDLTVCAAARAAYRTFTENPAHPSLRFKKLTGHDHLWSVRIGAQYRAVGEHTGGKIACSWIDSHNDFAKLLG